MQTTETLADIDRELTICASRLRHARQRRDLEAEVAFTAQLDRLLAKRHQLTNR